MEFCVLARVCSLRGSFLALFYLLAADGGAGSAIGDGNVISEFVVLGFEEFRVFEQPLGGCPGKDVNVLLGNVNDVVLLEFWSVVYCGFFVLRECV